MRDAVKKAEAILLEAEKEMGFVKQFMDMAKELGLVRAHVERLIENKENLDKELKELLEEIDSLRALSGVTDYGI